MHAAHRSPRHAGGGRGVSVRHASGPPVLRARLRPPPASATPTPPPPPPDDTNALHTRLHAAIATEDWAAAAAARDALVAAGATAPAAAWTDLGAPAWLADRAGELGFPHPTDVQRSAGRALAGGGDALVVAATGSGKTLAFLVPLLGRLRYPPDPAGEPGALAGPLLAVIVPTRDLGVQTALLIYRLLGGSVNAGRLPGARGNMFRYGGPRGVSVRGVLDDGEALAARAGGALRGAHVVVGTPALLAAAAEPGAPPVTAHCVAIAVDEADACVAEGVDGGGGPGGALDELLSATVAAAALDGRPKPQVVLVGATAGGPGGPASLGLQHGWLAPDAEVVVSGPPAVSAAAAATAASPASASAAPAALAPPPPIPSGLVHQLVPVPPADALAVLCRLLRADAEAAGPDAPPPRAVVFCADEAAARAAAPALRSALWGVHRLAVLLPSGREPVAALHAFRDGAASLLVATPGAARGLDVPAVSHVYSLGAPMDGPDYLHRAGRAGRIGGGGGGADGGTAPVITTLAAPGAEADRVRGLAAGLGVARLEEVAPPPARVLGAVAVAPPDEGEDGSDGPAVDADAARRDLEDLFWTRAARGVPGEDVEEDAEPPGDDGEEA